MKTAVKPKTKLDLNQLAPWIVAEATGRRRRHPTRTRAKTRPQSHWAEGGKARAKSTTKKERTASAKKAAAVRWGK